MQYVLLGRSGLKVSRLSFGSWVTFKFQINDDPAYELMKAAYKHGVNFFDNAEAYAAGDSESIMGRVIARGVSDGEWTRDDLVLSTKIFFGTKAGPNAKGLSRKHIVEGMNRSLERMKLDYVDLVFCHRPDPLTPIEETVRAMNHVIEKGQAFYWGTSEWNAQEITEACEIADRLGLMRPVMEQPQYNLLHRDRVEREYRPLYAKYGLGLTTWSPLASGILTGKYAGKVIPEGSRLALEDYKWLRDAKMNDQAWQIERTELLRPIAAELECTLAALSIAWCLKNDRVSTVITGATSVDQLDQNMAALEVAAKITPEIMARIEKIVQTAPEDDKIYQQAMGVRK